jgi:hypothetical protein
VPTKTNPLGAKGAGGAGCVGSLPAVIIAIMNASDDTSRGMRPKERKSMALGINARPTAYE